ncbi:MAG TPA: hypothetical protein ENK21_10050 [Trueperaceae bacterium]|nr:hypothetical protein [Trueperaceae bacterium]
MQSRATKKFWKAYARLDTITKKQAKSSYRLFKENPKHRSLNFKKIHNSLAIYSVRINLNHRALGILSNNEITWFWIGAHSNYEKLISKLKS